MKIFNSRKVIVVSGLILLLLFCSFHFLRTPSRILVKETRVASPQVCPSLPTPTFLSNRESEFHLKHFLVDTKGKNAFCFIPKCSCSFWKFVLWEKVNNQSLPPWTLESPQKAIQWVYRDTEERREYQSPLQLFTLPLVNQKDILSNFHRAVVVRNPYSRFLSFYRNKIKGEVGPFMNLPGFRPGMGLLETAQLIASNRYAENWVSEWLFYDHWATQCQVAQINRRYYDRIVHLENQTEIMSYLKYLFRDPTFLSNLIIEPTTTNDLMEEVFTDEIADILHGYYRCDFETSGYSRDWHQAHLPPHPA